MVSRSVDLHLLGLQVWYVLRQALYAAAHARPLSVVLVGMFHFGFYGGPAATRQPPQKS